MLQLVFGGFALLLLLMGILGLAGVSKTKTGVAIATLILGIGMAVFTVLMPTLLRAYFNS